MNLSQITKAMLFNSPSLRERQSGLLNIPGQGSALAGKEGGHEGMDTLNGALRKHLQRVPTTEPVVFDNPYSPDKVADTLTQHIRGYMEREKAAGASDERLQELYDIGVQAVADGFAEAQEILDQMGVLQGQIAADIDTTFDLFSQQASAMRDELMSPAETTRISPAAIQSYFAAESLQVSRSFEFELTTAEGDRVRINATGAAGIAQGQYQGTETSESGSSAVSAFSSAAYQRGSFAFEVQGDLNPAELEAIDALLAKVNDLSESFFAGNLEEAFDKALSLGFDGSQISRFELDLNQSSRYTAVEQYQSLQGEPKGVAGIRELAQYAKDLQQALEEASRFEAPGELLDKLFELEDALRAQPDALEQQLARHRELNHWLLESI
ncbi:DUF5610 domain-containing protein [Aestuariirhabdus litorea]|uniref:DUF5610 domain-containing protein n=1 Tax=Aestuariirhabdus litorea TaxID=2528527 RepID=A0A3P3VV59_9GAMM|nr:DUF5610 domain-containing protein [Aestuariirhabdus litorea]RRJ84633.1 hypothetical protein D0544_05895 [Aestuariirhabdus litorea]RWW97858.1 hypothetical protein DZC74_05890 [Endozoicomonadaceae bacterium GTF-13]